MNHWQDERMKIIYLNYARNGKLMIFYYSTIFHFEYLVILNLKILNEMCYDTADTIW